MNEDTVMQHSCATDSYKIQSNPSVCPSIRQWWIAVPSCAENRLISDTSTYTDMRTDGQIVPLTWQLNLSSPTVRHRIKYRCFASIFCIFAIEFVCFRRAEPVFIYLTVYIIRSVRRIRAHPKMQFVERYCSVKLCIVYSRSWNLLRALGCCRWNFPFEYDR